MPPEIVLAGQSVPLAWRRSERARRLLLRVDVTRGGIELVLPNRTSAAEALRFLRQHQDWLAERLAALPPKVEFIHGAVVPVLGVPHRIRQHRQQRGGVWQEAGVIHVAGDPEHLNRRVCDWLKQRAREVITRRVRVFAAKLGKPVGRISLRDPKSRWGSCSADGSMSFSWRLVLAPKEVLDYVVAHEVAHLAELNHGPRFWAVVARLVRQPQACRDWLRIHGAALHRYG